MDRKSQFKDVLECFPLPAYLFDSERLCFVIANTRYCALVGYTEQELIDLPWPKILPEDQVALAEKALHLAGPEQPVVWAFRCKDGKTVTVAMRYTTLKFVRSDNTVADAYLSTVISTGAERATTAAQAYGPTVTPESD